MYIIARIGVADSNYIYDVLASRGVTYKKVYSKCNCIISAMADRQDCENYEYLELELSDTENIIVSINS